MSRDLHVDTAAALAGSTLYPAWILRLDIAEDPVLVWTGIGTYAPTGTGDPALDGFVFEGIANIGEINAIVDAQGGSQSVRLVLPGVDPSETAMQQVITNPRQWQYRDAWIWVMLLNQDGEVIGTPVRVKKGRIDQMNHVEEDEESRIEVEIESHQAYAGQTLNTRWSEQKEIDATDTSQDYVHDLANKVPAIGDRASLVSGTPGRGGGYGGGGMSPFDFEQSRVV